MTDLDDPLLPFLIGELEQIEEAVGLRMRLIVPTAPLDDSSADVQTLHWTFRFTWQQVERGRRYVIPLPRETASQALQPVIAEINQIVLSALATDPRLVRNNSSIEEMRAELEALAAGSEVRTQVIEDGRTVGFVHDESALLLPVSAVERRIDYRSGLSAYSISESVRLGPLQVLRPDAVWVVSPASDASE